MRLVEFVGPPESGKTTIARRLLSVAAAAEGPWIDGRLLARAPRLGRSTPSLLAFASRRTWIADLLLGARDEAASEAALSAAAPVLGGLLTRAGRGTIANDPVLRGLVLRWALEALDVRAAVEASRPRLSASTVAVLDEGMTHPYKIAAFAEPGDVADVLPLLPLPDVLVRTVVPDEVLIERLDRRRRASPTGARGRTWTSRAALADEVRRVATVVGMVGDEAERRGVPVIEVDGTAAPEDVTGDLFPRIASALDGEAA